MSKDAASPPAAPDPAATSAAQTQSNEQTALYNFGLNNPNVTSPLGSASFQVSNTTPAYDYDAYNKAIAAWQTAQSNPSSQTDTSSSNGAYRSGLSPSSSSTGGSSSPMPQLSDFATSTGGNPSVNQNITLSPAEQVIFDQQNKNITQQGQVAGTALNNVTGLFNTPYNLPGNVSQTPSQTDLQGDLKNAQDALYNKQTQYLDPQFQQGQAQLESQLVNQGIPRNSEAWNNAMQMFNNQKQQAYQSAQDSATSGGAAYQAQLAQTGLANQAQQAQMYTQQYQEPLSLYGSLMSGTSPTLPQFSGLNPSSAAPTNVLGAYQNAYQGELNSYNAQVGAANSATSGIFGLGSTLLGATAGSGAAGSAGWLAALSDRRLKKNIEQIGNLKNGLPWYSFQYVWDDIKRFGVMADEVMKVIPDAVYKHPLGFLMVDYSKVLA